MLELKNITKVYEMGKPKDKNYQTVEALRGVSVQFRETEFVSILGQSGCGKTTLLNIIGGLDHYTDGDLIINGVSTKEYKDKDWDNYRNHKIGFVFQSYNLITHQTVLENVELALTLSGVSREERKAKATEALKKVGLEDKIYSKPTQLSGGQMQRVAIARAIVNNPDIILADEPTGALDTKTSVQIMDLLAEIAKEKLIIMVTHNPDLAKRYSTRIIQLLDGKIIDDTMPFHVEDVPNKVVPGTEEIEVVDKKKLKKKKEKTNMSFLTALSLSGKNLLTKKGRTILVSFAGSIGIIGISLILSLSNGFQLYINQVQQDTLSTYPLTIKSTNVDYTAVMEAMMDKSSSGDGEDNGTVSSNLTMINMFSSVSNMSSTNDLTSFKKYIEDNEEKFNEFTIQYSYDMNLNVYDSNKKSINPTTVFTDLIDKMVKYSNEHYPQDSTSDITNNPMISTLNSPIFSEMLDNQTLLEGQYELVGEKSTWPKNYDECVLVLNSDYTLNDYYMYALSLSDNPSLDDIAATIVENSHRKESEKESITIDPISYEKILNTKYRVLLDTDFYQKKADGTYADKTQDQAYIDGMLDEDNSTNKYIDLKIKGIVRAKESATGHSITTPVGYTTALTKEMIRRVNGPDTVLTAQKNSPNVDVLTGLEFPSDDKTTDEKKQYIIDYITNMSDEEFAAFVASFPSQGGTDYSSLTKEQLLPMLGMMLTTPDTIENFYAMLTASSSYNLNLSKFGNVDENSPSGISFYCSSFESKTTLKNLIKEYNKTQDEDHQLSYTDMVDLMMSSVTTIIDSISYVLIAFVSVSLIVSSIMIGIITYISVLERTKEIGVLRSIGASKKDIRHVFTAESLIIGFVAGLVGIGITLVLNIPINLIIKALAGISGVAKLPILGGVILVLLSCFLTFIAGLVPSKYASKKDPVIALRSE